MISLSLVGLSLVVIGWLVQLVKMKKDKKINKNFIILYSLGVAVLVYDGFNAELTNLAIANLVSLIVSVLVLVKVMKK
jgi:hypothetical protein